MLDRWHKRSGGFFLKENVVVKKVYDDGRVLLGDGSVVHSDVGWGEMRRTKTGRDAHMERIESIIEEWSPQLEWLADH